MIVKDENLIIVAKVNGRKYQVMPISSENSDSSFILDSNVFKGVIYD